ncbi:MAG: FG-GAP repeat domain-containing protein, partial [Candidatus Hodarchaeales archaeon]
TSTSGAELENYGYHILETWNTKLDLEQWTHKITVGDLDQDGKREIIVGDYDNNIYVFENLVNNTYKRAYRSRDLTHYEYSTVSPYAYEQLGGIGGQFRRRVWDHVEELIAGVDLDNDGYLEMIAIAGLSIYVWEQKHAYSVGINDEYQLVWQADFRQSVWKPIFDEWGVYRFSSLTYGGDLDYNGLGEFVVAADSFLFVFEASSSNNFRENFLINPYPVRGRYQLPGNPFANLNVRTLKINTIVCGDTDNDQLNEIIIGGYNETWYGQYNGFIMILENKIGTYEYSWYAPSLYMTDNPVYDLLIDDQDYDGFKEIIAGTYKGVLVYENLESPTGENDYLQVSYLSSFVGYPSSRLSQLFDTDFKYAEGLSTADTIELAHGTNAYTPGTWLQVFQIDKHLYYSFSTDKGTTWSMKRRVIDRYNFSYYSGGQTYYWEKSFMESQPSLIEISSGKIWLAFIGWFTLTYNSQSLQKAGIWLLELKNIGNEVYWTNNHLSDTHLVVGIANPRVIFRYTNPSLFEYPDSDYDVAVSYMSYSKQIYWKDASLAESASHSGQIPGVGLDTVNDEFLPFTHDSIRLYNGEYLFVFSGMRYKDMKLDSDIWAIKANSSLGFGDYPFIRVSTTSSYDLLPAITQTADTHTIMVIFKAEGFDPTGQLAITYSKDAGMNWRQPEAVNIVPPFARWISYPDKGISLLVRKDNPSILVKSYQISCPIIFKGFESGYSYSFVADYYFIDINTLSSDSTSAFSMVGGYSVAEVSGIFDSSGGIPSYSGRSSTAQTTSHSGMSQIIGGTLTLTGGFVLFNNQQIGLAYNQTGGSGSGFHKSATRQNAAGASIAHVVQSQQDEKPVNTNPVQVDTQSIDATKVMNIDNTRISVTNDDITGSSDGTDSQSTTVGPSYSAQLVNPLPSTPITTSGVMESYLSDDEEESDKKIVDGVIEGPNRLNSICAGKIGGTENDTLLATSVGYVAVIPSFDIPEDHGHRKNMFFGTNPSSSFSRFDFTSAYAISTGDTDNDYRKEILVASDFNVYLVELSSTSSTTINYKQIWASELLESQPTDVELFDANGNGWQEIIFSCTDGNVYSYEGVNLDLPISNPLFLDESPVWDNNRLELSYGPYSGRLQSIFAIRDYNNDNIDDLFVTSYNSSSSSPRTLYWLIDGSDGSIYWSGSAGSGMITIVKTADLNNDSYMDFICAFISESSESVSVQAFSGYDGYPLWNRVVLYTPPPFISHVLVDLDMADLNKDGIKDILLATEHRVSVIDGFTGTLKTPLLDYDSNPSILVKNVDTFEDKILVVLTNPGHSNTTVLTYSDINFVPVKIGSIHSKDFSGYSANVTAKLFQNEMNDLEILVAVNRTLYSLDFDTKEILWSIDLKGVVSSPNMLGVDLNGDGYQEFLIVTNCIEAFDVKTGQRLWNKFNIQQGEVTKERLTDFDNDGLADDLIFVVNLGNNDSAIGAIDCSNKGTLLLFKYYQNTTIYGFKTGYFSNERYKRLVLATEGSLSSWTCIQEQTTPSHKVAVVTEPQMVFKSSGAINEIAIIDANNDGVDDLVYCDSKNYLMAIDGSNADIIWKYRLPNAVIHLEESDVNLDGIKDILCLDTQGNMILINGEIGRKIWEDKVSKSLSSYNPDLIINQMTACDLNADGKYYELVIATGFRSSFSMGALIVYNMSSREIIWMDIQYNSPYYKFIIADCDNNGLLDIVAGVYGKYIKIYNGLDGSEIFRYHAAVQDFTIGDFSIFTYPDIAIIQRNGSVFVLTTINGWSSSSKLWEKNLNPKFRLSHLALGQFNVQPQEDLVIKSYGEASIALDGLSGDTIWVFNDSSLFYTEKYMVLDINNDGLDDVITLNYDTIFAISGNTSYETDKGSVTSPNVCWASFVANDTIISMNSADLNGDGIPDIVIGTLNGYLLVLNGAEEESHIQKSIGFGTFSIKPIIRKLPSQTSYDQSKYSHVSSFSQRLEKLLILPWFIWSVSIILISNFSHINKKVVP